MLVAYRLTGLSALEAYYAVVRMRVQFEAASVQVGRGGPSVRRIHRMLGRSRREGRDCSRFGRLRADEHSRMMAVGAG
jgi:hypothetical protein